MNNSKLVMDNISLSIEEKPDNTVYLRERERKLMEIIKSLQGVQRTKEWSSLKTELFDGLVLTLEKELREEAKKENPDSLKLSRIAGQLKWAEKYADLGKLESVFRVELTNLKKLLYGQTKEI